MKNESLAKQILKDPSASDFLKLAITKNLNRDACDAANDAEMLLAVFAPDSFAKI